MPSAHGQGEYGAQTSRLLTRSLSFAIATVASLVVVFGFVLIVSWLFKAPQVLAGTLTPDQGQAVAGDQTTTTTTPRSTIPILSPTTTTTPQEPVEPPPLDSVRYVVPPHEAQADAKQLAVDIALMLTTYESTRPYADHLTGMVRADQLNALLNASRPLAHAGHWSRGEVIYPQLGGLRNNRTSVMVVTRQTVGMGDEATLTLVRTLDIRLVREETGWVFDHLSSAGGQFDNVAALTLAHAVASDPRIEMPDSSRLDILGGLVSPVLLELMAEIADITPYGVAVLSTGHPHHVFETNRQSHHTLGRAVDIYRVGDVQLIDDRGENSASKALVEWLYTHPSVYQVGSPWDIDGSASTRSFTDAVHQDHIHIAVNNN